MTATVDSIPLIASSIMGKKLAADDDCIVLDVKTGSGSFMKSIDESVELAELMVQIGARAGKKMCALVTDMDRPLGCAIGNALEVQEAIATLKGEGPEDLLELCVALATEMLVLAQKGDAEQCEREVRRVIASGEALARLAAMVEVQGGDVREVYEPERLMPAVYTETVCAPRAGYITAVNTEQYGTAALLLGAGRSTKEDVIDMSAGIYLHAKTGDWVEAGKPIATLYTSDPDKTAAAKQTLLAATQIGEIAPDKRPLIFKIIR